MKFFTLIFFNLSVFLFVSSNEIFHVPLDQEGKTTLDWALDYAQGVITFEIHLPKENFGWFAFGFSDYGEYFPADYYVLWSNWKNYVTLQDAWADENAVLHLDEKQDAKGFKMKQKKNVIKFTFQRKFDTCDRDDYIIQDGTIHIVWSRGIDVLHHLNGVNVSSPECGMVRTQLLKNTLVRTDLPKNSQKLDVVVDKVEVPDVETTYWCHIFKLPEQFQKKHHILQYESMIRNKHQGLVHHMEVFHCIAHANETIPEYSGSCFDKERPESTQVCKRVLAAWAMGAKAFVYPEEAALPLGGENFNPYIMLEIHYNNPERSAGNIDSSGIRFHVTQNLREMDAGVIELGLEYTDKMTIPPGQESFTLDGYCVSECTSVSLPSTGIFIFGSQLHTHLTGIRVRTRHFRNGQELPEMNRDDHYSTHFQEIRRLKRVVQVLPGDALITSCDYNTVDKSNVTLGGFAITDEMCVNYVHYYPATNLEVCKSSISDDALKTFFRYMHEWEGQETQKDKPISESYKSIEWTPMRVKILQEAYTWSPLSMQCNMSSGDRYPGYWEDTSPTYILKPLPPNTRDCFNNNA